MPATMPTMVKTVRTTRTKAKTVRTKARTGKTPRTAKVRTHSKVKMDSRDRTGKPAKMVAMARVISHSQTRPLAVMLTATPNRIRTLAAQLQL